MSLLNVHVNEVRALVAVDTDGITPAGEHYDVAKMLPLYHAGALFAARGDRRFLHDVFKLFYLASAPCGYDEIADHMPMACASAIASWNAEGGAPTPYQVVVVGWSKADGRMRGRIYTGDTGDAEGFDCGELGARVIPWDFERTAPVPDSVDVIRELAREQAPWLRAKGAAGGGRLLVAEVTENSIKVTDIGNIRA